MPDALSAGIKLLGLKMTTHLHLLPRAVITWKSQCQNNSVITLTLCLKCKNILCTCVRVPGYRSIDPGFDSRRHQIFWKVVGLERGPLSLVSITEELLERIRCADDPTPSISKIGTNFADMGRSLGRYSSLAD
jgi:hypothetical protein